MFQKNVLFLQPFLLVYLSAFLPKISNHSAGPGRQKRKVVLRIDDSVLTLKDLTLLSLHCCSDSRVYSKEKKSWQGLRKALRTPFGCPIAKCESWKGWEPIHSLAHDISQDLCHHCHRREPQRQAGNAHPLKSVSGLVLLSSFQRSAECIFLAKSTPQWPCSLQSHLGNVVFGFTVSAR